MNNRNTHTTASLLFAVAFLGTAIFALTEQDFFAMGVSLVLGTIFSLVALQSETNN